MRSFSLNSIISCHCVLSQIGSTASIGKAPLADLKSGLATAPTLFAAEEFPELTVLIGRKFEGEGDIELALELVRRSQGQNEELLLVMYKKKSFCSHLRHIIC